MVLNALQVHAALLKVSHSIDAMKGSFGLEWRDSVYFSFKKYIKEVEEQEDIIKKSRNEIDRQCDAAAKLKDSGAFEREINLISAEVRGLLI